MKVVRSRKQRNTRSNTIIGGLLVGGLFLIIYIIFRPFHPRGCGVVKIWSHRGHLDSSSPKSRDWTCDHVLKELKDHNIRHLDIDIVFHGGQSIVAHPTELSDTLGDFSPSPCSKIPLKIFLQKLKHYYGPDGFFLTMEPKSSWTQEGDFLAAPQDVVGGILDVLEEEPVSHQHCGIILQPSQLADSRVASLEYRIHQNCLISAPLKRSDTPLSESNFPPADKFGLIMPTIELFGGSDGELFLKRTQREESQVILWIVDTVDALQKALQMRGVHGVISNHPVRLQEMYEQICHGYNIRGSVG